MKTVILIFIVFTLQSCRETNVVERNTYIDPFQSSYKLNHIESFVKYDKNNCIKDSSILDKDGRLIMQYSLEENGAYKLVEKHKYSELGVTESTFIDVFNTTSYLYKYYFANNLIIRKKFVKDYEDPLNIDTFYFDKYMNVIKIARINQYNDYSLLVFKRDNKNIIQINYLNPIDTDFTYKFYHENKKMFKVEAIKNKKIHSVDFISKETQLKDSTNENNNTFHYKYYKYPSPLVPAYQNNN